VRLLVAGANGQLGSDLAKLARLRGFGVSSATRADADVTDCEAVTALLGRVKPACLINTTAWTDLPGCEREPGTAFAVNAVGALNVARAAAQTGTRVIHVSTDYVFDGGKSAAYREGDARRAVNVYGSSKLAGEDLVRQACQEAAIVRVAGLFGVAGASGKGGNFVETMLRLAREGKPIRVVADQVTSPTFTEDAAGVLLNLAEGGAEGEYHAAAAGSCSWYEFAEAIFEMAGLSPDFAPTTAAEYGGPVTRPANSALASDRIEPLPHWRDGLERYLRAKGHIS
jgi:dTDP-4-dehydrorhamnose reductase